MTRCTLMSLLFLMLPSEAVQQHGYRRCLGTRPAPHDQVDAVGPYEWLAYDEVHKLVRDFGSGLRNLRCVSKVRGVVLHLRPSA